jgi:hypothetical protein
MLFAGTDAVSVQVPAVRKLAVVPVTVQTDGVVEPNVTGPFDVEVALRVAVVPAVSVPSAVKLMVCAAGVTVVDCVTGVAGR